MKSEHKYLKEVLSWITHWCLIIGDVLFGVWLIQMVTQFEAEPSYPFLGKKGWIVILGIYCLGLISELLRQHLDG